MFLRSFLKSLSRLYSQGVQDSSKLGYELVTILGLPQLRGLGWLSAGLRDRGHSGVAGMGPGALPVILPRPGVRLPASPATWAPRLWPMRWTLEGE